MKKYFIVFFISLGVIFLANNPASASISLQPGDLIKTATNPAIYYYGADLKRHLYPNESTFWTWNIGSWKDQKIKTLSQADFNTLNSGTNITARPGENFIKFDNGVNLYAVMPAGYLCAVNQSFAQKQKIKKIVIQSSFEADYQKSSSCSLDENTSIKNIPEGSIFKYENGVQTFYMDSDGIRQIVGGDGWNNNRFNINSVLVVKAPTAGTILPVRTSILAREDRFGIDSEFEPNNSQSPSSSFSFQIRSCDVTNGSGYQNSSDGHNWTSCVANICSSGFVVSNGSCIKQNTSQSQASAHDLWLIIEKYKTYLKNHDMSGINSISYKDSDGCNNTTACDQIFDYVYNLVNSYNESDFAFKLIDDRQAILWTPIKKTSTTYEKAGAFFAKNNGEYKLLSVGPRIWHYSLSTSEKNAQELDRMYLDSDSDGLTNEEEKCEGAQSVSMGCKITDPYNKDTDGDGLWDGIEDLTSRE